jgi:hypothetical protein
MGSKPAFLVVATSAFLGLAACHPSVENDCNDYDALALQCPNAVMISPTDDEKFCKAFAASSAAGKCDDKNKAQYDCLLGEPNVCDSSAASADCTQVVKDATNCMRVYCENHKDDPGCARTL